MSIQNLSSFDPWKDTDNNTTISTNNIHIRIQQRNGKKRITTVQGLDDKKYDLKMILKEFKKEFHCNGSLDDDPEFGKVIRLTGDNRKAISDFLMKENICSKENIKIYGE